MRQGRKTERNLGCRKTVNQRHKWQILQFSRKNDKILQLQNGADGIKRKLLRV